jgi:hypothetical protein
MDARLIDRIETSAEVAAAALFGGSVAYAAYTSLGSGVWQAQLGACASGAGLVAFFLCIRAMRMLVRHKPDLPVSIFNIRDIQFEDTDELVLTNADRLDSDELLLTEEDRLNHQVQVDPLMLDDILAEIGPEARVVRLFDRKAMPTPGQLKSRIDSHLGQAASPARPSDASQALSEALAELRRSLR